MLDKCVLLQRVCGDANSGRVHGFAGNRAVSLPADNADRQWRQRITLEAGTPIHTYICV